jgi:hypothetical protein
MKRHVTTIVLALLAIALGVYAYVVDRGSVTEGERRMRENNVFPAWRREDVTRIELSFANETFAVVRDSADGGEKEWRMTSPRAEVPDASAVDHLVAALETASIVRRAPQGGSYGFDAPRARGTIAMGKVTYVFLLGAPAPTPEGASYLKLGADSIFVVSKSLTAELMKPSDAYRERTVPPYLSIDLARFEIVGHFAIERADDVSFTLAGTGVRASRERLDIVWKAMAEMRAETFLRDDAGRSLAPATQLTIRMTPKDPARPAGEILVGGECPGQPESVVAIRRAPRPLVSCVPKGVLGLLSIEPVSLADTRLFAAHDDEIEELAIEAPGGGAKIELARKGSGWRLRAPEERDLSREEAESAADLVGAIARAEGVIARDAAGAGALRARVTVKRAESGKEEVVECLAGGVVRRGADQALLAVDADVARVLEPRQIALRPRTIWPDLPGKPASSIAAHCNGLRQDLARKEGLWTLTAPSGFSADAAAAVDVADAVTRMRAEAWIADADDGSFGFSASTCSIALTLEGDGGAREIGFVLGRDAPLGVYARILGDGPGMSRPPLAVPQGPVCVVPKSVRELASTLLVDRHAFSVDTARVRSLRITEAGKMRQFIGPSKIPEAVADALGALQADRALHLGPPLPSEGFGAPSLDVRADGSLPKRFVVGRETKLDGQAMMFARIDGTDATFVIAKSRLTPLFGQAESKSAP